MDITFTADQLEARDLAREVFTRLTSDLRRGADSQAFNPDIWAAVQESGLVDVAIAEDAGGAGLDLIALALVVAEAGRVVLPVPLALHAAACQVAGPHRDLTTVALASVGAWNCPPVVASATADSWHVQGVAPAVPYGQHAGRILVGATIDDEETLLLLHPDDDGVEVIAQTWSGDYPVAELRIDAVVPAQRRISGYRRLLDLVQVLSAAQQWGIVERAVELTARYVTDRHQFSRPIGSFQAVSQRLADAWIAVQGLRLTMWQAAWLVSCGREAATAISTAQFWAAEAGDTVAHAVVHLHGGAGVDLDGPIHPYFVAAKRLDHQWGGAGHHARRIGHLLSEEK